MKKYKIGILGATGVVGRQMIECLEEYRVDVEELRLLASKNSEGKKLLFNGKEITIQEATPSSFKGLDFVLGAVENAMAKEFAPYIVKEGAVFIDNSSAFRQKDDVPLVIPQINGEDAFKHNGIISNPNCSTIITLMAIAAINKISPITKMQACTYQAVSGAGKNGLEELINQLKAISENKEIESSVFPRQIAMNVIPWIGKDTGNGYTSEEMKMQNEGRKILHNPNMLVSCTCVRVPVLRSHSISLTLQTKDKVSVEEAKKAISKFEGVKLSNDYPTPLEVSNQDTVYVGRVREDLTSDGLNLWCCGDQIRKGAASNAVQILCTLINR